MKLKIHLEKSHRNSTHTLPKIQNELIALCDVEIKDDIITKKQGLCPPG